MYVAVMFLGDGYTILYLFNYLILRTSTFYFVKCLLSENTILTRLAQLFATLVLLYCKCVHMYWYLKKRVSYILSILNHLQKSSNYSQLSSLKVYLFPRNVFTKWYYLLCQKMAVKSLDR